MLGGQDGGFEELESSVRAFLGLLESSLNDLEFRKASAANWLAECEQALRDSEELVDAAAPSGLVLCERIGLELAKALNMYSASQTLICCISLIQGLSLGKQFARTRWEVPTLVMELVELMPVGGLSLSLLLTENQIDDVTGSTDQVVHKDQKRLQASKGAALAGYWALSNSRVAAAVGVSANSIKGGFQITGRKLVIAALSVATSLLNWHASGPQASVPAAGLTLLLELASTLEFPVDDDEGDGWMALTLRSLPIVIN